MAITGKTLLVAGALVFWGLQAQFLWLSAVLAALVVGSRLIKGHLSFTEREFARLWDVTVLVLVGAAVYQRQTSSISGAVLSFLQWLPILCFPLMAALAFSDVGKLPYSTFVFWWRGRDKSKALDFTYVYFAICVLAASASANRTAWFYAVATGLIGAGLWLNRPRRIGARPTLALLAATGAAGFFLQAEWRDFHTQFESKTVSWFAGFFPRPFEDQETYTSMGDVAKLKSSGRVLMRLETARASAPPRLLRQVSFDQYRRDTWLSTRRMYAPVTEASPGRWELSPADSATNSARLCIVVPEARILLPLPAGAARARDLVAARLERNRFGNVRVWDCADPLQCWIDFDGVYSHEPEPSAKDLQVPGADEPAVQEIAQELGLSSMVPRDALLRVGTFFAERFRYEPGASRSASGATNVSLVAPFLTKTRAGHCEYFATSAALILRKAGIPARYAMGFAAVEPAGDRGSYRIRERHAHAWVLAYVDGRWIDFDPTPGSWPAEEARHASMFSRVADMWAELKFKWATTRVLPEFSMQAVWWGAGGVGLVAIWTLWRKRKTKLRKRPAGSVRPSYAWPGLDSEFFEVERSLRGRGLVRKSDETAAAWLARAAFKFPACARLRELVTLHYKYRFDPTGLSVEERRQLSEEARSWVSREMKVETR
jgi:transglutaminase-like putative cysteine protease